MPMRVALDARRLQDVPLGGVGRGIANLLEPLSGLVELVLLLDASRPAPEVPGARAVGLKRFRPAPEPVWLNTSVARWLRAHPSLFHGTYNAIPAAVPGPAVVTLHDLSFEHHPVDFASAVRRRSFQLQARWAARKARRVITVSEFVRQELIECYHLDPGRVGVVPNAVDPVFRPLEEGPSETLLQRLGIQRPYVVAIGGARRRRLGAAVEAWHRTADRLGSPLNLVVVGPERPPPAEGIVPVGRLGDEDWAALLAGAEALCYPTSYEGFGMPALEAAACGTPVVAAPVASLPEVLGDAAEWCDSLEPADLAEGLVRVLTDPARRRGLRDASLARAAGWPSWTECAHRLVSEYELASS